MTQIAAYRNNSENETQTMLEVATQSLKQLICKQKFTNAVKKPIAYFYGILNKKFAKRYY